jgi:hypothetical protein
VASEYERYQQKVERKKNAPKSSVKLETEEKPLKVEPTKAPTRKRH